MRTAALAGLTILTLSSTLAGQTHDHANCPMASKATAERGDGVDQRHNLVTGIGHESSVHHFLLSATGGTIRLEVTNAADTDGRDRIRRHLQMIARSFARGDFALPMLIHDQVPPGVEVMKKAKAAIRYEFAPTDNGGEVRISSGESAALSAIHQFLRFQIEDHGTGDPTQ